MAYTNAGNDSAIAYINRSPTSKEEGYGYNGIAGWKPGNEWLGFEQTTVGPASSVLNRLNTQNGLQSTDPAIMAAREPLRVGRFLVKWVKAPAFFPDLAVKYLRYIFEDGVREVSGVPENSLDKIDIQNGAVGATTSYPGIYKESGNSVTLKVRESAGSPVRKFLDYWISGVSDRKTGVCHMYGFKGRAILPNMAGSILYVLLGPTCRPEDIEFACMWHEVMPYGEKASHLNSGGIGEAGSGVEFDVEFSGMYDRGPEIDIFARKVVEGYNLYGQTYLNQLLPSYMYDQAMFAATDWSAQNTIDLETRIQNIADDADNDQKAYDQEKIDTRNTQFSSAFEHFRMSTTATNLGEMGIMNSGEGFVQSVENRTEVAEKNNG